MRRFEFVEGTSAKFWMADVQGDTFIVVFGRLGTDGQRKEKKFPDEEGARKEYTRKVAEKLREGYQEVSGGGSSAAPAAPAAARSAPAAPARPPLPPRVKGGKPTAAQVAAAVAALGALESALGGRSWRVALHAGKARRALRALGGVEPTKHAALEAVFSSLMAKVVAPRGQPRLAPWIALELLEELDVAAFSRTLEQWKRAPEGVPARGATAAVVSQAEGLGEPELALRLGALLGARPRGGAEAQWDKRWQTLRPHVEGHLVAAGSSLPAWVRSVDTGGDARLAERLARLGA